MPQPTGLHRDEHALRDAALAYPEAHEDFPWGERALKVRGKVFLFLSCDGARLSLSMKLPESRHAALTMPFATPTGYGLGKAGWVTSRFGAGEAVPLEILRAWLDESYRAVAPKAVVKQLDARGPGAAQAPARGVAKPARPRAAKAKAKAKAPATKAPRAKGSTTPAKKRSAAKPAKRAPT